MGVTALRRDVEELEKVAFVRPFERLAKASGSGDEIEMRKFRPEHGTTGAGSCREAWDQPFRLIRVSGNPFTMARNPLGVGFREHSAVTPLCAEHQAQRLRFIATDVEHPVQTGNP